MTGSNDTAIPSRVDDVLVGSSPLMLMRALDLAKAGRRVLVLERAPVLGGAWYAPPRLGFESLEAGVHLIENRRSVYRRLEGAGVEMGTADRDGMGVWRSIRVPLSVARVVSFLGVLVRAALELDRNGVATTFPRALRSISSLPVAFRYPRGGAGGMVSALAHRLEEHGVVPFLGCWIEEVMLRPDAPGGVCRTSMGAVSFDSFCFSSRAHCPIRIGDDELIRPVMSRETLSLIVLVRSGRVVPFSYVEVLADPLLRRARDVTGFAAPAPPDATRVLCVQLREAEARKFPSDEEIVRRAMGRLAELGLVDNATEVLGFEADRYTYHTIPDRDLVRLASKHVALVAIKTTDFAEDMLSSLIAGAD